MKKQILFISIVILSIVWSVSTGSREVRDVNELLLKNIECLATSEEVAEYCIGAGTVDCPGYNIKVMFYWL